MRQSRVIFGLVLVSLTAWVVGLTFQSPASAQGYSAEGDIEGSNPALGFGVTEIEFFSQSCPGLPESQGVDGYVFELPRAFDGQTALARGESAGPYDLDFSFYTADCSGLGSPASADPDESAPLPAGTKFVLVNAALGAQIHVCLTVGGGTCGGATSAPPSSSATASQSASTSPSGSTSASASSSASSSASGSPSAAPSSSASATASSSPSPPPSGTINTTINRPRRVVRYKGEIKFSGSVSADSTCRRPYYVELYKKPRGSGKESTLSRRIPVSNQNEWLFTHKSRVSANYAARAISPNCTSEAADTVGVGVKVKITFQAKAPCRSPQRVTGLVRPKHPKTKVVLGRKQAGKFKTVGRDKLNKKSRYVLSAPSCKGRYRIVWPSQRPSNAKGTRTFHF